MFWPSGDSLEAEKTRARPSLQAGAAHVRERPSTHAGMRATTNTRATSALMPSAPPSWRQKLSVPDAWFSSSEVTARRAVEASGAPCAKSAAADVNPDLDHHARARSATSGLGLTLSDEWHLRWRAGYTRRGQRWNTRAYSTGDDADSGGK